MAIDQGLVALTEVDAKSAEHDVPSPPGELAHDPGTIQSSKRSDLNRGSGGGRAPQHERRLRTLELRAVAVD
jgi:hypothetical protein